MDQATTPHEIHRLFSLGSHVPFSTLKSLVRGGLYHGGLLGLLHRWMNRRNLTVVMFHSVIVAEDPRWDTAEDAYTMRDTDFEQCLRFFNRHYSPVSLSQLRAAWNGTASLPARPLLVTFDDGWLDNLSVALPLLEKHRIPATIFVASSVLDSADDIWWHDIVVYGWNSGALDTAPFVDFRRAIGLAAENSADAHWRPDVTLLDVIVAAARLDAPARDAFLLPLAKSHHFAPPRQMLDQAAFEQLARHPLIAIGAHGHNHLPMTYIEDAGPELTTPKRRLKFHADKAAVDDIYSMSFPHGRYDHKLVKQAQDLGYELVFTSDAIVNPVDRMTGSALGRIDIPSAQILDRSAGFAADRLATWLFTRQSRRLSPVE